MRSQSAWKRRFGDRLAARYSLTWSSRTLSCSVVLALAGMHRLLPSSSSPDEASPLPAPTVRPFRSLYPGGFLTAALQALRGVHGLRHLSPGSAPPCPLRA